MSTASAVTWLRTWFAEKNPDRRLDDTENYFEAEVIDSFDVIDLIESVETTFNCRFAETDFQDRRFVTIAGLAEIIAERTRDGGR